MSKRENTRWERRERKYRKRRYGMRVSGRSIKAVLLPLIGKKSESLPFPRDPIRTRKPKRRKKRR